MASGSNLRLGELHGSQISFPNARIVLHNFGNEVRMNGRSIYPGDERVLERDQITVRLKFLTEESVEHPLWDESMLAKICKDSSKVTREHILAAHVDWSVGLID